MRVTSSDAIVAARAASSLPFACDVSVQFLTNTPPQAQRYDGVGEGLVTAARDVERLSADSAAGRLRFTTRASASRWADAVWTCTSEAVCEMTAVATARWGLVFWQQRGRSYAAVTGPETSTSTAPVPEGADFVGIEFAIGTSLRMLPTPMLVDGGIELPDTRRRSFRLDGGRYETPGFDDAEALVARLVRDGALVQDPLVAGVVRGDGPPGSARTLERRFRQATGLTQGAVRQVERARAAAVLLAEGNAAQDVVSGLEYFDQSHLARALRRYVGRTAGQLGTGAGGAIALDVPQPATE